jgi:hypothetical protein
LNRVEETKKPFLAACRTGNKKIVEMTVGTNDFYIDHEVRLAIVNGRMEVVKLFLDSYQEQSRMDPRKDHES